MTAMLLSPATPLGFATDDPFGELLSALGQPFGGQGTTQPAEDGEAPSAGADDADGAENQPGSPDSGR